MHKQSKYKRPGGNGNSILLFVLLFSLVLICLSLFFFTGRNEWLKEQLASSKQNVTGDHIYNTGWAYAGMGTAIFLIIAVVGLLFWEISKRNKLINELTIQKDLFRDSLNSTGEGLVITGKEGKIVYMDPLAEKLSGCSTTDAFNLPVEKVFEFADKESVIAHEKMMDRILGKGETVHFENKLLINSKNKQKFIVSNTGSPLSDCKGNIRGSLLLLHDISESKRNEKKSDQSELFNRGILDALNSHIVVINSAGTIINVNKAWKNHALLNGAANLEKYDRGANYFLICKSLTNDEDETCSKALEGIKNVLDGLLDEFYLEFPYYTPAGEKWYYMRVMKFEEAKDLVVIEHHDITARKKEEEKTLKAIEQYDILSQATSDTIWDWNIPGNQVAYNEGVTKMFGYKISEVENAVEWWKKNIHPDDLQRVSESLAEIFKNGKQNLHLEYRFRCSGGSYKYIYDRAFVLYNPNGGPIRIIGAMQDVTYEKEEEKRMAKAIIDAEERERHYIGQELHDNVNQILAGSLLTIAMAKQKHIDAQRVAELMELSEEYLAQAIDEVRKLSHKLAPASFDEMTLKDIFESLLVKINLNNQYKIRFDFDEAINVSINEDIQINLYRILQEQVKNILKYSSANAIEIGVSLSGNAVRMRTFDNGQGFDIKIIKKGIGLSNIKKRVDSFSGKFILNTSPGNGCEMTIEIPLKNIV